MYQMLRELDRMKRLAADFLRGRKPLMSFGGGGAGLGMLDSGYREEYQ